MAGLSIALATMASAGTPTDIDTHSVVLSTSWQEFGPYVLTPTADRSDLAYLAPFSD